MTHALALRTLASGGVDRAQRPSGGAGAVGAAAVGVAGVALVLSLEAAGTPGARARAALLTGLIVLVPVAVGLYASRRASHRRFGQMLVAAGFLWSTTALAQTDGSLTYSIGRLGGWTVTLLAITLVLGFPDGRPRTRLEHGLLAAAVAAFAALYLPTALLVEAYPAQSPWAGCDAACPPNAFMVLDHQPAFVDAWLLPLRELLTAALALGALGAFAGRVRRATPLQRLTLVPALVAGSGLVLALAAFLIVRRAGTDPAAVDTLGWIYGLCVPGLALGLLAGLARWQLYVGRALRSLTIALRRRIEPDGLRAVLAGALEDPALELARPGDHGWVDERGRAVTVPPPHSDRAFTEIRGPRGPVAALVHDRAWSDDPAFLEAVRACVLTLIEREDATAIGDAGRHELESARARLLAEMDGERRRLERDLHDGAQQRLVGLRIRLGLALDPDAGRACDAHLLEQLGEEVDEIIDEIRSLARGVYPSLLADRGLPDALTSAALRMPLPTHVDTAGIGRYDEAVEAAVYFTCLEALQNAAKHADGATAISLSLRASGGALRFEVRDDGAGFDVTAGRSGAGLSHMHDRASSVGGTLTIGSEPGRGTWIAGTVPLAGERAASPAGAGPLAR